MALAREASNTNRLNPGWFRPVVIGAIVLVSLVAVIGQWILYSMAEVREVLGSSLSASDVVAPLFAVALTIFGGLVVLRGEPRLYGWLMLTTGSLTAIMGFAGPYARYAFATGAPFLTAAAWIQDPWLITWMLWLLLLPALFPDGSPATPRWRIPIIAAVSVWALLILTFAIAERPVSNWFEPIDHSLLNPTGVLPIPEIVYQVAWILVSLASFGIAMGSLISRGRHADIEMRQRMKLVLVAFATLLAVTTVNMLTQLLVTNGVVVDGLGGVLDLLSAVVFVALPVALGMAVLKFRLYDVDLVINRTIVYGILTVLVIATYIAIVVGVGALLPTEETLLALVATGVAAVAFAPLRERLQRVVNGWMFGQRDDPYALLSRMGRLLAETGTPEATLQNLAETVAESLKLPGAAIEVEEDGTWAFGAVHGSISNGSGVVLPIRHHDQLIGRLVVMPRSPNDPLTQRDMALLEDISHHVGAVAESVRLNMALKKSKERLIMTREEERRRIRRDLHDGLGPGLASQTFQLDEILERLHEDPDAAAEMVVALKEHNRELMGDIRALVYELRPPTLDELGVAGAIRAQVGQFERSGALGIEVTAVPDPLPDLPAAVEVAAYRIAREAIANTIRHASATRCTARLEAAPTSLIISVRDNGEGFSRSPHPGVGLTSMRERCEELGGTFEVRSAAGEGTEVIASLPVMNGTSRE